MRHSMRRNNWGFSESTDQARAPEAGGNPNRLRVRPAYVRLDVCFRRIDACGRRWRG
jgi:hypothetical protein